MSQKDRTLTSDDGSEVQHIDGADGGYSTAIGPPHRVTQTVFFTPEDNSKGVYGNCTQAALASLLGLPLDAVPHVMTFADWEGALRLWLAGVGLTLRIEPYIDEPDGLCLVAGRSPRGVGHIVARFSPEDEWDPHPSRDGLVSRAEVWYFDPRVASWHTQQAPPPPNPGLPSRPRSRHDCT